MWRAKSPPNADALMPVCMSEGRARGGAYSSDPTAAHRSHTAHRLCPHGPQPASDEGGAIQRGAHGGDDPVGVEPGDGEHPVWCVLLDEPVGQG